MEMISEADALVETLNVAEAKAHLEADSAIVIDFRDIREVAKTGKVRGANHVPRGMLEFWIDLQSPYHKDFFTSDQKFNSTVLVVGGQLWRLKPPKRWAFSLLLISKVA